LPSFQELGSAAQHKPQQLDITTFPPLDGYAESIAFLPISKPYQEQSATLIAPRIESKPTERKQGGSAPPP
jgi:hypothetical protein